MRYEVRQGDCREVMAAMDAESIDSIVTDPPYGLSFMGKGWDHSVPGVEFWDAALRVAKPGAHLLAFGGTRLFHRLTVAIEDAGWEIRDTLMWVYGSGFPKSHNGDWGDTALKPAWEPIIMARKKPEGTVAANFEKWGTGGLNIDGCRVGTEVLPEMTAGQAQIGTFERGVMVTPERIGRWPANLMHDGSEEVVAGMGDAQRYFYCPKANKKDRDEGLDEMPKKRTAKLGGSDNDRTNLDPVSERFRTSPSANHHPTVKPTDLMAYLCRLVTPKGGVVLDPFCGSGSTGKAAVREGFNFTGIELDPEYADIARARIEHETTKAELYT